MPITAPINTYNAGSFGVQTLFPQFFEVIRNHKAYSLHLQFAMSVRPDWAGKPTNELLNEYAKEKKKLMKELKIYKHICKQPGSVIDSFMWKDHMVRPANPVIYAPFPHAYADCPNPEECSECRRP